jgi:DNA-binding NtrC family response regulator
MRRRVFIGGLIGATAAGSIDLDACGDKFLRVGRSARFRRYAAVHPAAILIYAPRDATRQGIDELKSLLKRAGHSAVALERAASVSDALTASHVDVVIADYLDADRVRNDLQSASSGAALLPILTTPDKAIETEAMRQYAFLLAPHKMTKFDALAEIDRLMESRSQHTATSKQPA